MMAEAKKPQPKKPAQSKAAPKKAGADKTWYEQQMEKIKASGKTRDWVVLGVIAAVIIVVIIVASVATCDDSGAGAEGDTTATAVPGGVAGPGDTTTTVFVGMISDGTYLVGKDIPAGVYKGEATSGGAYYQISTDANGLDIVKKEDVTAQFYLEVKDGEFLRLNNVAISLSE